MRLNLLKKDPMNYITYSTSMLEFIRTIISQVSLLKFRSFKDTHDMTKITRIQIEELINDIATMVKKSINEENIIFDDTLFTTEFYNSYIIEVSIIVVKDLLDKEYI